jgi:hypothetical protein
VFEEWDLDEGAGLRERRMLERLVEQLFDPGPAVGGHGRRHQG